MTDYGHDLLFGTFVTPRAQPAGHAVRLSRLAENVGLDLVTFQDHPYQPAFLDTWTLLSYVAGQTARVGLALNVTNLPLRPPPVLARSVASLDRLSGGRVALGLGAGAFWDAIEAMGGHRLSGGEAVDALEEAIEVIRQLWDTQTRGGVRVDGRYHRVMGAKRGPAPAHDVPIWLGAYKPRMLRMVGRVADGWLPSLGYLPGREALTELNEVIDEAARGAGRDPRRIRRLLNVGDDHTAESLAELCLQYGVSALILGSDDETRIRRFGEEVAPEVRRIVAEERSGARPVDPSEIDVTVTGSVSVSGFERLGVTPTPDDGSRLSAAMPWDEATRPTALVSADGAAYPKNGRAVAQHLIDVHDALRGELEKVRDLVEQVRNGLAPGAARSVLNELALKQNNWSLGAYCQSYCRFVTGHHSLEDQQIFPHLRSTVAGLAPVVDRLQEEHLVIHGVIDEVDRALVRLAAEDRELAPLERAVDLLTDTLLSHLSYEERELVDPLARHGFYDGQV